MKYLTITLCLLVALSSRATASDTLFIYPAGGQSDAQLAKDRYQCYRWAVDQTGVDPNTLQLPKTGQTMVRNEQHGAGNRGFWLGTLAGAALGNALDGHSGGTVDGAIIGASLGNMIGVNKERKGVTFPRKIEP
ncbi:glycine zipper domain-containing protein [Halioxenophilus aromaticivorans]|uniref:Glycine zipper domain-containing protein n=1 Tax=Halioxenophilus aromaticivorans TaxID=1306992 RepID=A0AAV3U433_9ALTE